MITIIQNKTRTVKGRSQRAKDNSITEKPEVLTPTVSTWNLSNGTINVKNVQETKVSFSSHFSEIYIIFYSLLWVVSRYTTVR